MHYYSSSRSNSDLHGTVHNTPYSIAGDRLCAYNMAKYPQYSSQSVRRKTQYDARNLDYAFDHQMLLQRTQLYNQLYQEKLANQRSKLIIEDLLQQNEKKNKTIMQDIVINKMPSKNIHHQRLHQDRKYLEDHYVRPAAQTQRYVSKNKSLKAKQSINKNKQTRQSITVKNKPNLNTYTLPTEIEQKQQKSDKKDITKSLILKKLYQSPSKKSTNKLVNSRQKQQEKYHQNQLLKDQINFLKDQLSEKNRDIVELQCEIVKLKKFQSIALQIHEENVNLSRTRTKTESKQHINKNNLKLNKKCLQVLIKGKKTSKKLSKDNQFFITLQKQKQNERQKQKQHTQLAKTFSKSFSKCISLNLSIEKPLQVFKLFQKCNNMQVSINKKNELLQTKQISTSTYGVGHGDRDTQTSKVEESIQIKQKAMQTEKQEQKAKDTSKLQIESQYDLKSIGESGMVNSFQLGEQAKQSQIALSLSQSQPCNQVTVQNKGSKLAQIKSDNSLILSKQQVVKQQASTQTQDQYKQKLIDQKQVQTQSSVFDLLEDTYLQWMFDKEYKEMERKKKKQANSSKLQSN